MNAIMRHGGNTVLRQKFNGKLSRRPAAGVEAIKLPGFCVPIDKEEVAADTVHHRLCHAEHGIRGNGCIHGGATLSQHLSAGLRRQIMAGGNNAAVRHYHGTAVRTVLGGSVISHCHDQSSESDSAHTCTSYNGQAQHYSRPQKLRTSSSSN